MNSDNKLNAKIASAFTWELVGGTMTGQLKSHVDVAAVRQAFADAGYIKIGRIRDKEAAKKAAGL